VKPVADPEDSFDVLLAVRAQVFSQPADVHTEGMSPNPSAVSPDTHKQDLPSHYLSRVLDQHHKQLVFFTSQLQTSGIEKCGFVFKIDFKVRVENCIYGQRAG
jgi:hypothetical protein